MTIKNLILIVIIIANTHTLKMTNNWIMPAATNNITEAVYRGIIKRRVNTGKAVHSLDSVIENLVPMA